MSLIELKNVSKIYNSGKVKVKALTGINLNIEKGEFVSVIGRSGSGKTTLLNMIGALDVPTSGSIFINGNDISKMKDKERTILRRKEIGFIFQSYELLPVLTVEENISFPQIENDEKYVEGLMKDLELLDKKGQYPFELSGGQRQRVAVARALVNHPSLILADEPTGNLDSKTEKIVMELLYKLVKEYNTTLILITHNEELTQNADKVYKLKDGEI
ncbi:putative ABC transporter ATP-binding protein YknY [Lachnospiraceae bacterium]|nr:putative ABC transporter ATP-binding protein YknY [Lachnospiraceae bacterium]